MMDNRVEVTRPLVRLACELGADVIKCDLPDKLEDFSKLKHVVRFRLLAPSASSILSRAGVNIDGGLLQRCAI